MPTVAGKDDPHVVTAPRDGSDSDADRSDVLTRIAVQSEDPIDAIERTGCDHIESAPGHRLFGRLENQAYTPAEITSTSQLGQNDTDPDQHRGVDVMATRMAGTGNRRSVVDPILLVVDRKSIKICAQRDGASPGPGRADVADHA
jgi:hypothetical protein